MTRTTRPSAAPVDTGGATDIHQWETLLSRILPMEVDGVEDTVPFRSEAHIGHFGPIRFIEVKGCAQRILRRQSHIQANPGEFFFVSAMTHGDGWLRTGAGRREVTEGNASFVDCRRPYQLEFEGGFAFVSAAVPRQDLLDFCPAIAEAHGGTVAAPAGPSLSGFLKSLAELSRESESRGPPLQGKDRRLYDHFIGLVATALEPAAAHGRDHDRRLLANIKSRAVALLGRDILAPAAVAAREGISERKLQRLFQADGTTFSRWLQGQRLERCRQDLANPDLTDVAVATLAANWGFLDSAYFSRRFRALFGVSPGAYRTGHIGTGN